MGRRKGIDIWDVIFVCLILLSITFLIYKPRIVSNIVQGRDWWDLDSSDDPPTNYLIENTDANRQRNLGFLNVVGTLAEWVFGSVIISSFVLFLLKKAGWKRYK